MDQAVETAFRNECAAARIPDSYRTEAVRLDLLHNVRLLYHDGRLPQGAHSRFEEPFAIEVAGVHISGKIDRIEVDAQGKATVVDYKYRSKERMGATKRHWEQGALVQAGLYSLAVQRMGYQPATVVYCGFKREVALCGWSEGPELVQIIQEAKERTLTVVQQLRDGRIEPLALDEDKCRYCGYANACRKETYAMSRTAANRTNA